MYKKQTSSPKQVQKTSDREIQGTKDALIQDLERKLRCKDNLLHNGNQVRSYVLCAYNIGQRRTSRMVAQLNCSGCCSLTGYTS